MVKLQRKNIFFAHVDIFFAKLDKALYDTFLNHCM